MWKPEHRRAAERRGLRYLSDLTDAEWALVEPMIPPAKRGGRRREVNIREVLNAIFYVLATGCQWQALPNRRRARRIRTSCCGNGTARWSASTMRFMSPRASGKAGRRVRRLRSSTVKAPKRQSGSKGGSTLDPQGFDAAKKVTGRKRHILVDTLGLLLNVVVHSAAVQDRDGARLVLDRRTRRFFPFIERIFADAGYQGPKMAAAVAQTGTWKIEVVKRDELHRFLVLPKRWIVERTLAWISHYRRLARDFERYARSAAALVRLAMIRIMRRRLTRPTPCS
ncbi:MAG TPA: IS5 family transposase [Lacipirellulaceae bacterium]|nr:IS5 family transposase [Lacipirellulaceae bacterium]